MKLKLRKIDAIILVTLIIVAGYVFHRVGYIDNPLEEEIPKITFFQDDDNFKIIVEYVSTEVLWSKINITGDFDDSTLGRYVHVGDELTECRGTISLTYIPKNLHLKTFTFTEKEELPESILSSNERAVSPDDEGPHYNARLLDSLLISREWWYYTAVLNTGLPGWTVSISFNHMSRNDLFYEKPDILVVVLNSPNGESYGGVIDKERYLGILRDPTLQATSSNKGFKVSFEDSYAEGQAPGWHVHIEGDNIDSSHNIEIDLHYSASSNPLWTFSSRPLDKSKGKIASYIFTGCDVSGTIKIDGVNFKVDGIGHHEHTWASGVIPKAFIRGWDWCHMTLDNGWNVYYSNYYLLPQIKSTKTTKITPFSSLMITTNKGETITKLDDLEIQIKDSEKNLLFLNLPTSTRVTAQPSSAQILLRSYNIELDVDITADNTIDRIWKRLANVGMRIGRVTISGKISWSDDDGKHDLDLNGIGTIWNMRH